MNLLNHKSIPLLNIGRGFVFFALLSGSIAGCKSELSQVEHTAAMYEPAKETGKGVELVYTENGKAKIKLIAPEIVKVKLKDPYIEFPAGLEVLFYDDSMNVTSTLQANYAIRYEAKKETIFKDSVRISNSRGDRLSTEEMIWDEKESIIYSDKFTRIITENENITGEGFSADQEFSEYTITGIRGKIYVETDQPPEDF